MEPTILYEDKDVLVINKPAGLVVHSNGRSTSLTTSKTKEKTLVDWLVKKYPEIKNVGEPGKTSSGEIISRPGIVHRLDRETSGVMIVAKTQEAFLNLKEQFQKHQIKKIYHAFVFGEMKNKKGTIDRPIGRSSKDFRAFSAQRGARGEMREAETEYEVMKTTKEYSFVQIMPKTGRTHQIRVHFKAVNYPLVSDPIYAKNRENTLGFKRLALHSHDVTFKDLNGKEVSVSAPYPEDFKSAVALLQSGS